MNGSDGRRVATPDSFQSGRNLTERGALAGGLDGEFEQVALPRFRAARERFKGSVGGGGIASAPDLFEAFNLTRPDRSVVDFKQFQAVFLFNTIGIHADDDVLAAVDACLAASGRFLNPHLRQSH